MRGWGATCTTFEMFCACSSEIGAPLLFVAFETLRAACAFSLFWVSGDNASSVSLIGPESSESEPSFASSLFASASLKMQVPPLTLRQHKSVMFWKGSYTPHRLQVR